MTGLVGPDPCVFASRTGVVGLDDLCCVPQPLYFRSRGRGEDIVGVAVLAPCWARRPRITETGEDLARLQRVESRQDRGGSRSAPPRSHARTRGRAASGRGRGPEVASMRPSATQLVLVEQLAQQEGDGELLPRPARLEGGARSLNLVHLAAHDPDPGPLVLGEAHLAEGGGEPWVAGGGASHGQLLLGHERVARVPNLDAVRVAEHLDGAVPAVVAVANRVHELDAARARGPARSRSDRATPRGRRRSSAGDPARPGSPPRRRRKSGFLNSRAS